MIDEKWKARFWSKVRKASGDDCWLWTASAAGKGYGQIKVPGTRRQEYAHRLSYRIHFGDIPDGMMVCHKCDTPLCVRPDHLFLGDAAVNLGDMAAKDRHLYGERNTEHRLVEAEVNRIFDLADLGWTQGRIAKEVGTGQMNVCRILRGERWRHVWKKRRGK